MMEHLRCPPGPPLEVLREILGYLGLGDLVRMRRCSRAFKDACDQFSSKAFDVDARLGRFFEQPTDFRSLMARTSTVISGSFALQFFDRSFYPGSDLDLYVHGGYQREVGRYLLDQEGYRFSPRVRQTDNFNEEAPLRAVYLEAGRPEPPGGWRTDVPPETEEFHQKLYDFKGVLSVFTFTKDTPREVLKVQIIVAQRCPLHCILDFHSTCVMNIISFDRAFSLYPRATFDDRNSLAINVAIDQGPALRKYVSRGYLLQASLDAPGGAARFFPGELRWPDDAHSCVMKLPLKGVALPQPLTLSSPPLRADPIAQNSWALKVGEGGGAEIVYRFARSACLRYIYLVGDLGYLGMLGSFFTEQGGYQYGYYSEYKYYRRDEPDVYRYWQWWDAKLPEFKASFLELRYTGELADIYFTEDQKECPSHKAVT